jgi:hypothetical protein
MAWVRTIVFAALVVMIASVASAQDLPIQIEGRVTWIAGQGMAVAPDGNTPTVNVDISRVPQDQHANLREGDRVVVTGAVNNERTRVIAASVERLGP